MEARSAAATVIERQADFKTYPQGKLWHNRFYVKTLITLIQLNNSELPRQITDLPFNSTSKHQSARSSPLLIPTFLPVRARGLRKAFHRPVHILPRNFALTFADQVDDPLMGFQVFTPQRRLLLTGRHAHANEGKKRQQNAARMFQQKWIAGGLTQMEMKLEITIQHSFAMTRGSRPRAFRPRQTGVG